MSRSRGRLAGLLAAAVAAVTGISLLAVTLAPAAQADPVVDRSLVGYWQNFDNGATPLRLRDVPPAYDVVVVAFAERDAARPGAVTFALDPGLSSRLGGYTETEFTADVAALQSQGRQVAISVGGELGTVSVADPTAAANFADSVAALMDEYGFDGVDIDLENGLNPVHMATAMQTLAGRFGPDLLYTMAPQTIDVQGPGGSYYQLIERTADILDIVHTQYYNSGAMLGRDGRVYSQGTVDFITALADILLAVLRPDQVALGLPASPRGAGSGAVAPSVVNDALSCLAAGTRCGSYVPAARYPSIRGAMTWSINWDALNGYAFANTVRPHLDGLPGGGGPGPSPSVSPPASPSVSPPASPSVSPSVSPPAGCAGLAAWSASTVYVGGNQASYAGRRWTAKWWTLGEIPGVREVWADAGAC